MHKTLFDIKLLFCVVCLVLKKTEEKRNEDIDVLAFTEFHLNTNWNLENSRNQSSNVNNLTIPFSV